MTRPGPDAVAPRYRVGDLSIDAGRQRVTRGESVIALPKLSYDLLMTLVRSAPDLVSLDELMGQVWPKAVVSPETLSQRVKLLRDALGDDPRAPRYIEGLRGRGYRLIPSVEHDTPVVREPSSSVGSAAAEPGSPSPQPGGSELEASTPPQETHTPVLDGSAPESALLLRRRPLMLWAGLIVVILLGGALVAHRWIRAEAPKPQTSIEVSAVQPRAVAVLPFDNLSSEPNNDYIALGIADSVLNRLAGVPELIVVARSSSFALGKPTPDAREAGRRLGVRYLVSGSVQRAGKTLRVTAQLTDTTSNASLWSLKLDRAIDDVFVLQDQIAQRVAQELDVTLQRHSTSYAQYGTDAYLAFLKGRALLESRRMKDNEESIREFSRAVELAPTFAAAITELARAKGALAGFQSDPNVRIAQIQPELDALVDRAIQIDPSAGEAYFLRADYRRYRGDASGAEADFLKGLELAPNFGPGLRIYAEYLFNKERYDEALALLDRARLVDPLSAESYYYKAEVLRLAFVRYDEAAALYLQALSVQPEFYPAYSRLAMIHWEQGALAEAIRYGEKSLAIEPAVAWTRERLVWFYVDLGDLQAARDVFRGYAPNTADLAAAEALVCYRAGKLERTESILRKKIRDPDFNKNGFAFFIATHAVVDRAVLSHDPSAARQFLLQIPGMKDEVEGRVDASDQVVRFAELEQEAGSHAVASELAERALQHLGPSQTVHFVGEWDEWARAAASAILGRNDAALAHLETLVRSGSRIGWWARIEGDPVFAALHSSPRFQAITSGTRAWLQGETQRLAQLRESGEVPRRSADKPTASGC